MTNSRAYHAGDRGNGEPTVVPFLGVSSLTSAGASASALFFQSVPHGVEL
jgi:hypothetical protein